VISVSCNLISSIGGTLKLIALNGFTTNFFLITFWTLIVCAIVFLFAAAGRHFVQLAAAAHLRENQEQDKEGDRIPEQRGHRLIQLLVPPPVVPRRRIEWIVDSPVAWNVIDS